MLLGLLWWYFVRWLIRRSEWLSATIIPPAAEGESRVPLATWEVVFLTSLMLPTQIPMFIDAFSGSTLELNHEKMSTILFADAIGRIGIVLASLAICSRFLRSEPWRLGIHRQKLFQAVVIGFVEAIAIIPVINQATALLRLLLPPVLDFQFSQSGNPAPFFIWNAILVLPILAPIAEELLFRGILQQWMTEKFGSQVGLYGSSFLFAVVHWSDWPSPIPIFFFSLALGTVFRRSGSLWTVIALHATFNLPVTIMLIHTFWLANQPLVPPL